jgi:hypothetical protein
LGRPLGGAGEQPVDEAWSRYGWWLLSDDGGLNPDMWGWNHVLVPYCSQDLHSGQVSGPPPPGPTPGPGLLQEQAAAGSNRSQQAAAGCNRLQ